MEVITTHLEMRSRPSLAPARFLRPGMLLRLDPPTVGFYRYLYTAIGSSWGWDERRELDDDALGAIILDPAVDVFVLYVGGVPAGMFELDRRVADEIELRHLGLVSEFIGRGLGKHLVTAAVEAAWDHEPDRLWVRSTSLEHPQGVLTYQWAGFTPYQTTTEEVDDPEGSLEDDAPVVGDD